MNWYYSGGGKKAEIKIYISKETRQVNPFLKRQIQMFDFFNQHVLCEEEFRRPVRGTKTSLAFENGYSQN